MRLIFLCLIFFVNTTFSAAIDIPLQKANIDPHDKASLQRGAKTYMNYCAGCHSLQFMRYSRMAKDIGIVDDKGDVDQKLLKKNLIFTDAKVGDLIEIGMLAEDAAEWFGIAPPDLSVDARKRGVDWLYTYLLSFYRDDDRPWGTNNWLYEDVAMPNVLLPLQGEQVPVFKHERIKRQGEMVEVETIELLKITQRGLMHPTEFRIAVRDLVNFLAYVGEPIKLERQRIGYWVIGFLLIFWFVAYLLKKEYWKDV